MQSPVKACDSTILKTIQAASTFGIKQAGLSYRTPVCDTSSGRSSTKRLIPVAHATFFARSNTKRMRLAAHATSFARSKAKRTRLARSSTKRAHSFTGFCGALKVRQLPNYHHHFPAWIPPLCLCPDQANSSSSRSINGSDNTALPPSFLSLARVVAQTFPSGNSLPFFLTPHKSLTVYAIATEFILLFH
ncbi:hypothetical protein GOP47_0010392 [Adiantum capillus-veneris]|uniref:Uncharacterized protein n=1 Tax=Adiantum capillus-veneris TaxID=13818 RepID=A0A9D4UV20_ADICA|nr:hypothetical protein GOP47_0010392 [Adiantum capillus-veneris]